MRFRDSSVKVRMIALITVSLSIIHSIMFVVSDIIMEDFAQLSVFA